MYEIRFLIALGLTVAVETLVLLLALTIRPGPSPAPPRSRIAAAGVLASAATLPYLWFIMPRFVASYVARNVIGEIAVVAVEAVIIALILGVQPKKALFISLAANAASVLAGWILVRDWYL